jgi:hypothetical protein
MRNVATPLEIAGYGGSGGNFAGKLDDVRLYNRVLSASEILDVYNEAFAPAPPVISSISVTNITAFGATINWVTDEPADSQVDYGATAAYGASSALDSTLILTHSRTLTSLTPNSLYHYRILSRDASGNLGTSGDLTFATAPVSTTNTFFVAPNGNDNNSGTAGAPFLTIQRAQAAVRSINSSMGSDITVYLRQGTYPISSGLVFDSADSGTNGNNVIYASYPGERATISGGRTIVNWTAIENGIYRADASGLDFRQLYINGVPGVRARTPNDGSYHRLVDWKDEGQIGVRMDNGSPIHAKFPIVRSQDIMRWLHLDEVEFVISLEWTHLRFHIADFMDTPEGNRIITPKEASIVFGGHAEHKQPNQPYYFENAYEFLDDPGEWYLDRHQGALFYIPRPGENIATAVVTAPVVERLMQIQGGSPDSLVQNIQFQGLTFENSNWTAPSSIGFFNTAGDDRQLGTDLTALAPIPGAVHMQDAANIRFERNIFHNLGGTGVLLYSGVSSTNFIGNVFQDIAGSGIALEARYSEPGFVPNYFRNPLSNVEPRTVVQNNLIKNNYFNRVAREYPGSMGVYATYIQGLIIEHNEFYDLPYAGISVGTAGWRYWEETPVRNNVTRYNRIHNVMNRLADGGGIYVMGNQPNSMILENYIYDLTKSPFAGGLLVIGIYLDSRTGNYTVQNNVIENMDLQYAHFLGAEAFNNTFINPIGNITDQGGINTQIINNGNINPPAIKAASGIEPAYQDIVIP